jgi:uncharacterized protein (DUF1778 family)
MNPPSSGQEREIAAMKETTNRTTATAPTEGVLIRFDPNHLEIVSEAADYLGLPRSAWMRSLVIREAREVLASKAEDPREVGGKKKSA